MNLAACDQSRKAGSYTNKEVGYSFEVPAGFAHTKDDDEGMYFGYADTSEFGHVTVQSYDHNPSTCSGAAANPLSTRHVDTAYTITGKIPPFPCPVDACNDSKYGMSQYKGRYALCSEHDGKVVRIEINEITDNPKLAEQIFSTFRWTQ